MTERVDIGTPEERRRFIGGSDAGAIVGLSPFKSALAVYLEKTDELPGFAGNEKSRWGNALEDAIALRYSEDTGRELVRVPRLVSAERPWMAGHPDRAFLPDNLLVEIKTAGFRQAHRWGEPGSDEIPPEYLAQVVWYMALGDYSAAEVPVLFDGSDFRIYRVERDRELERHIITLVERFWERHVLARVPPALDASDAAAEWLERKHPRAGKSLKTSTPELDEWAKRLREAKRAIEKGEEAEAVARANLCAAIGADAGLRGDWGRISWSNNKGREVTNWKAIAAEAGVSADLIAKHTTRTPFRMFRATFTEEK